MAAEGWRGVEVVKEEDAVAARPPCDELDDGVMDDGLFCGIPTFPLVDVEGEEVSMAGDGIELVADGCGFTIDGCLP